MPSSKYAIMDGSGGLAVAECSRAPRPATEDHVRSAITRGRRALARLLYGHDPVAAEEPVPVAVRGDEFPEHAGLRVAQLQAGVRHREVQHHVQVAVLDVLLDT